MPTSVPGGADERCPQVTDTLQRERLLAMLSASFGALALLMAAVGLYGVTSYAVNLRRTEIGIRMALGATRGSVIRLVLGCVALLIGGGIVVGLAVGAWASRFVATRRRVWCMTRITSPANAWRDSVLTIPRPEQYRLGVAPSQKGLIFSFDESLIAPSPPCGLGAPPCPSAC